MTRGAKRVSAFLASVTAGFLLLIAVGDSSRGHTPQRHRPIVFDSDRSGTTEIYTVGYDGSDERRITRNRAMDARPAWSPNGEEIVFHSTRDFGSDGNNDDYSEVELYVMRADGANVRRLTDNEDFGAHPDWCSTP